MFPFLAIFLLPPVILADTDFKKKLITVLVVVFVVVGVAVVVVVVIVVPSWSSWSTRSFWWSLLST